jgi:hypothetical protein
VLRLYKEGKEGVYASTHKNFKKAFIPFAIKLTALLIDLKQKEALILDFIKNFPEWDKYETEEYKSIVAKQNIQLGGGSRNEPDPFEIEPMNENSEEGKTGE